MPLPDVTVAGPLERIAAATRQKSAVVVLPPLTTTELLVDVEKPPDFVAVALVVPGGTLIIVYCPLALVVARNPPGKVTTAFAIGALVEQFVTVPLTVPRAGAVQVGNLIPPKMRVFQLKALALLAAVRYSCVYQ